MSRPGIGHGPPAWEASTLEKSYPDSLLMAIRNIYIWARRDNRIFLFHVTEGRDFQYARVFSKSLYFYILWPMSLSKTLVAQVAGSSSPPILTTSSASVFIRVALSRRTGIISYPNRNETERLYLYQCCGSALVSRQIRIQLLTSMRIRTRIQGAKPMRIRIRIRMLVRLCRHKKLYLKLKNILYVGNMRMRSSLVRMRSSLMVRASDCQCTSCNCPGFDPSIRRHSGIWGAAAEAVLNIVRKKNPSKNMHKINVIKHTYVGTKAILKACIFVNFGKFPCSWIRIPNTDSDTGEPYQCGSDHSFIPGYSFIQNCSVACLQHFNTDPDQTSIFMWVQIWIRVQILP